MTTVIVATACSDGKDSSSNRDSSDSGDISDGRDNSDGRDISDSRDSYLISSYLVCVYVKYVWN